MNISGSATNSLTDAALHTCLSLATASAYNDMTGNLVISWNLTPVTNAVELQVEIKDAASPTNYDNWLPTGNLVDPEQPGNSLKFIARLMKPDGTPSTDTASSMKCTLAGVSHEPGVCMNFPNPGGQNGESRSAAMSVRFAAPNGFDWVDAGIGAIVAFVSMLLVLGLARLIPRRSHSRLAA